MTLMFTEYPDLEIVSHHSVLGGCIGASAGVEAYVKKKVATWVECVRHLARAAEKFPQSTYVGFTTPLQSEWNFLHQLIPESSAWFGELNDVIQHEFIPALGALRASRQMGGARHSRPNQGCAVLL